MLIKKNENMKYLHFSIKIHILYRGSYYILLQSILMPTQFSTSAWNFLSENPKSTKDNFLQITYNYVYHNKNTKKWIISEILVNVLLTLWIADTLIQISEGSTYLIALYLILSCVHALINDIVIKRMHNRITVDVVAKFTLSSLQKYDTLSFSSKNKNPANIFWTKTKDASHSLESMIDWGIPTFFGLLSNIIDMVWTFYRKNLLKELLTIVICCFSVYYFLVKPKQKKITDLRKSYRKQNQHGYSKIQLSLIPYQYREIKPEEIYGMDKNIRENWFSLVNKIRELRAITSSSNQIIKTVITFACVNDIKDFLLILNIVNGMTNSVQTITSFMNQYMNLESEFQNYVDFWDGLEFMEDPKKMDISEHLEVTGVDIVKGDFKLKFADSLKSFPFFTGMKILIRGKTGGGKTTLLEGLTGKIKGVTMNEGKPENYYHTTADMFQNIREKMPSSKVTIRDFFKNEMYNDLIKTCLKCTFEDSELDLILGSLSKKENYEKHPFDVELDEILSGGQKSRLCLATRCYELEKFEKKILIMDEPEQGSDPRTAVTVIQKIFDKYTHCTIIMISHMCGCQLEKLQVDWNLELEVKDGTVFLQKK